MRSQLQQLSHPLLNAYNLRDCALLTQIPQSNQLENATTQA
jgi:hypothetical protein